MRLLRDHRSAQSALTTPTVYLLCSGKKSRAAPPLPPAPPPALPPPHTCHTNADTQSTVQTHHRGREMAGQQSHEAQSLEKTWCGELSIERRVPAPALLSHPLWPLCPPFLGVGLRSFHSEVLLGRQSSQGTDASTLPDPGPHVHSSESPAQPRPACGPLGPGVPWLSRREVPAAPAPAPSSRLQLPGKAGQFPLVVDDLQLLDISPGAGWTPGAQGLLRAWRDGGGGQGGPGHCFVGPFSSPSKEQISLIALHHPPGHFPLSTSHPALKTALPPPLIWGQNSSWLRQEEQVPKITYSTVSLLLSSKTTKSKDYSVVVIYIFI